MKNEESGTLTSKCPIEINQSRSNQNRSCTKASADPTLSSSHPHIECPGSFKISFPITARDEPLRVKLTYFFSYFFAG